MQIGFNLPISGPLSSPETMTRIAQHGEALGYDYLTLTDHVVLPNLRVPGWGAANPTSKTELRPSARFRTDSLASGAIFAQREWFRVERSGASSEAGEYPPALC